MEMPPLPPYIYGREAGPNEKVYTEQVIREHGESCARMAREEERERCMERCKAVAGATTAAGPYGDGWGEGAMACAAAIRKG